MSQSEHSKGALREDETLHLDGCALPGDHAGPCIEKGAKRWGWRLLAFFCIAWIWLAVFLVVDRMAS